MTDIFKPQGPLPNNHNSYINRKADQKALQLSLKGEYLKVIAPRQFGKTSLLFRLKDQLTKEGWRCAYIDLSIFTKLSKPEWYTELGNELTHALTPGMDSLTLDNHIKLRKYLLDQVQSHVSEPQTGS